jgi:Zn-finger nucleic acid-binding protein
MKCPACGNALTSITAGGITVNACKGGCGGMWFDRFELSKVDEPSQSAGEVLLHIDRNPAVKLDSTKRLSCPKCSIPMMRHFWSVKKSVLIDECPECGGTWLDAGELAAIRTEFATPADRTKAAEAYFNEVFGKQLTQLRMKDDENAERAQKFAHMFRYICPSYYIPGKQQWGAF